MVHFPPLPGYPDSPGLGVAARNARQDVNALLKGGVDGIMFENNYDIPHKEFVEPATLAAMSVLGQGIRAMTRKPLGVNVLWNDYPADFALAKVLNLQFVRIPVFVDKVRAECGIITGQTRKISAYRKKLGVDKVAILTDVHVKHSVLLSKMNLVESGKAAIRQGSDGLVLTGKWTGQAPDMRELQSLRKAVGKFPIFIGSGTDVKNVKSLLKHANGVIVSTSLKRGEYRKGETNIKTYSQRLDPGKVGALVKLARER